MTEPSFLRRRSTWIVGVPLLLVLGIVGGTWLYLNVLRDDAPERLTLDDAATDDAASDDGSTDDASATDGEETSGIEGAWQVGEGTQVGYRVQEVLFGQEGEAAGRTSEVSGTMTIDGSTVTEVDVEVDVASIESGQSLRDGQFRGRIMDTATHPTATFTLTEPIELDAVPTEGEEVSAEVTGELTLRGVTNTVTVPITARLEDGNVSVLGTIPIGFDDYDIPDASGGPASVGRDGELEILLVFTR